LQGKKKEKKEKGKRGRRREARCKGDSIIRKSNRTVGKGEEKKGKENKIGKGKRFAVKKEKRKRGGKKKNKDKERWDPLFLRRETSQMTGEKRKKKKGEGKKKGRVVKKRGA